MAASDTTSAGSSTPSSVPAKRVTVWADPEIPGPPLYRSDIVDGYHRNLSYGWTWWSARQVVALPAGMTFLDALVSDGPVEVTIVGDVSPLASGLNEVHQRIDADWSSTRPEPRLIDPALLCEEVGKGYQRTGGDLDDATDIGAGDGDGDGGQWGDYFRKMRDIERRDHGLPRAVVRSDDYGRQPHHHLVHDWPDGTFTQGGKVKRDRGNGIEDLVFIETFPRDPSTYLRGEGATFAEAESSAWERWEKIAACPSPTGAHEFETRGYRNGAGFCRHCNLFQGRVFDLREIGSVCVVCAEPYYTEVRRRTSDGDWETATDASGANHYDMVCRAHYQPAALDGWDDQWDYLHAITDHLNDPNNPDAPLLDIDWMRHRLPADLSTATWVDLQEAYKHAQRDWLDALIADKTVEG